MKEKTENIKEEIPRIYTIPQIVGLIHCSDPDSAISASTLRDFVSKGLLVPVCRYGNKTLLNYGDVLEFLRSGYKTAYIESGSPIEKKLRKDDEETQRVAEGTKKTGRRHMEKSKNNNKKDKEPFFKRDTELPNI